MINILKKLGVYVDQTSTYPTGKEIPISFLENSLLCFIHFQIIFYYQSASMKKVAEFSKYLKENAPVFFGEHDLKKVYWRSSVRAFFFTESLSQIIACLSFR